MRGDRFFARIRPGFERDNQALAHAVLKTNYDRARALIRHGHDVNAKVFFNRDSYGHREGPLLSLYEYFLRTDNRPKPHAEGYVPPFDQAELAKLFSNGMPAPSDLDGAFEPPLSHRRSYPSRRR